MNRPASQPDRQSIPSTLRIIGGTMRGRKLAYSGDPRTRPMKDRTREAVFNLVGPSIKGSHAIDLFAGTGAMALEAISRGSARSTAIERHFPTARLVKKNAESLEISDRVEVVPGDTFIWAKRLPELGPEPCTVFCCPPYALYEERLQDMLLLINTMIQAIPEESQILVESDDHLDWSQLPDPDAWDVRRYHPSVIGKWTK